MPRETGHKRSIIDRCAATRRHLSGPRMSSSSRNSARLGVRNQRERLPPQLSRLNLERLLEQLEGTAEAEIRLLYAQDEAAQPLRPLFPRANATMPIAPVEPTRSNLIQQGDSFYNARLAVAVKMGLPLAVPTAARLADGWTFGPRRGKWELLDPTGTLIASCMLRGGDAVEEPAWTAQAMTADEILIVYGDRIGVRDPDGMPASQYDDQQRARELIDSLSNQQVCAATVRPAQPIRAFRRVQRPSR